MKQPTRTLGILCVLAGLSTTGHLIADDKVDEALKSRDMNTIMSLLTVKEQEASAAKSNPNDAASDLNESDLKTLRERLAAELQAAREEAKRAGVDVASTNDSRAPKSRTFEANDVAPASAGTPSDTTQTKRNRGIFDRLFSGSAKEPKAADSTNAVMELAQANTGANATLAAPVRRPAPAIATPNAIAPTSANEQAIKQLTPPPIRTTQPDVSGLRENLGPRGNTVRENRDALDALVQQSRTDIVNMAMSQASGNAGSNEPAPDPDAWKEAGPNAWKYNGEWQGGTMHGQGRMTFADGWEYVGMWQNGVMHGQGSIVYPGGTRYEGQWRNGKMDGYGTLTYADGWKFIGMWKDGKIHGSGTLVNPGN